MTIEMDETRSASSVSASGLSNDGDKLLTHAQAFLLLCSAFNEPRADSSPAELAQELDSGVAKLWRGERSALVVRVRDSTTGERVCDVAPAAGDLQEILTEGSKQVEEFARLNNCTQIQVWAGRLGWQKALAPLGYEPTTLILRKLLP